MKQVILENVNWQTFIQIREWLADNVGQRAPDPSWLNHYYSWAVTHRDHSHTFYFKDGQTATLFGFRWMQ